MKYKLITDALESDDFWLDSGFASTPRTLINRMNRNSKLQEYVTLTNVYGDSATDQIFGRVVELIAVPVNSGCHHPHDLLITTYIYLLIMCLPLSGVGSIEALHTKLQMIEHEIIKCRGLLYSQWTLSNAIQVLNHRIIGVR